MTCACAHHLKLSKNYEFKKSSNYGNCTLDLKKEEKSEFIDFMKNMFQTNQKISINWIEIDIDMILARHLKKDDVKIYIVYISFH